jgi:hypothetical protein
MAQSTSLTLNAEDFKNTALASLETQLPIIGAYSNIQISSIKLSNNAVINKINNNT